jgi:hypothetical protein
VRQCASRHREAAFTKGPQKQWSRRGEGLQYEVGLRKKLVVVGWPEAVAVLLLPNWEGKLKSLGIEKPLSY